MIYISLSVGALNTHGVSGLAINSIYVPVSLVALWVFLKDYEISMWLIVGTIVCIIGTVVMYWEKDEIQDSVRDVDLG